MNSISLICVAKHVNKSVYDHIVGLISVMANNPGDYEIILISSGYSDHFKEKITAIDQSLPIIIRDDDGEGIYVAMNLGIKYSSKQYIYFSNPGDSLLQLPSIQLKADIEAFPVKVCSKAKKTKKIIMHNSPIIAKFVLGGVSNQKKTLIYRKLERYLCLLRNVLFRA